MCAIRRCPWPTTCSVAARMPARPSTSTQAQVLVAVPGPAEGRERDVQLGAAPRSAASPCGCRRARTRPERWWRAARGRSRSRRRRRRRGTGSGGSRRRRRTRRARAGTGRAAAPPGRRGTPRLDPDQPRALVAQLRAATGWGGSRARRPRPGPGRGWPARPVRGVQRVGHRLARRRRVPRDVAEGDVPVRSTGAALADRGPCLDVKRSRTVTEATHNSQPETTPGCSRCCTTSPRARPRRASCSAAADGQVRPGGVSGWYAGDVRLLDTLGAGSSSTGRASTWSVSATVGADRQEFSYVARSLGDRLPDPTVRLDRARELAADSLTETVPARVGRAAAGRSRGPDDGDDRPAVDGGGKRAAPALRAPPQGRRVRTVLGRRRRRADRRPGARGRTPRRAGSPGRFAWPAASGARSHAAPGPRPPPSSSGRPAPWSASVAAADVRRPAYRRAEPGRPRRPAAGRRRRPLPRGRKPVVPHPLRPGPLWAARMLVPFDTGLALSTLRVLARRQGSRDDPATEEQPGKILHEVRRPGCCGSAPAPAALLRHRRRHPAVRQHPRRRPRLGRRPGPGAGRCSRPRVRCLGWLMTQSGGVRLAAVRRPERARALQPGLEGQPRLRAVRRRLGWPSRRSRSARCRPTPTRPRSAAPALLEAFGAEPVPGLRRVGRRSPATASADEFWVGTDVAGHVAIALDGDGWPSTR